MTSYPIISETNYNGSNYRNSIIENTNTNYYGCLIGYTFSSNPPYANGPYCNSVPTPSSNYPLTNGIYMNNNTNTQNSAYITIFMESNNPIYCYYGSQGAGGGFCNGYDAAHTTNTNSVGSASGGSAGYLFLATIIPKFTSFSTAQQITIFVYLYNDAQFGNGHNLIDATSGTPSSIEIVVGEYNNFTQSSGNLNCPDGNYTNSSYAGLSTYVSNDKLVPAANYVQQYYNPPSSGYIYSGNQTDYSYTVENVNTFTLSCIGGGSTSGDTTSTPNYMYGGTGYSFEITPLNLSFNILGGGGSGGNNNTNSQNEYSGGSCGGGNGGNYKSSGDNATLFGGGGGSGGQPFANGATNGGCGYPSFALVYTENSLS